MQQQQREQSQLDDDCPSNSQSGGNLEQTFGTAQTDEKKNECSEEQLNNFSQQAEGAVALKLTAKAQAGEKEEDEHSEEWLSIFSTEAENNATGEVAEEEGESGHSEEWLNISAVELKEDCNMGSCRRRERSV
jgi:hypothetical protein